jgi:ABC-2 type transport system permease protein
MNKVFILHLKMIFSQRLTLIVLTLSSIIMLVILSQLSIHAENKSSIPVGITNLDESETADNLVRSLKNLPALNVYEGTEGELAKLLKEEKISVYFVIGNGYEISLEKGKTADLITLYYAKGDEKYKILSDIIAGEMLYPICLNKGYNLYQALDWKELITEGNRAENIPDNTPDSKKFTKEEYVEYADTLTAKTDFNFAFDIALLNPKAGANQKEELTNSVIYEQIIIGIIGMLYAFIAMSMMAAFVMEKENPIHKRLKISLLSPFLKDMNQVGAVFMAEGILSIFLVIILSSKISAGLIVKGSAIFSLMLLFSLVLALLFLFLSKRINQVEKYQLTGTIIILFFGLAGFLNLLSGFINPNILKISKIIPNNWFIQGFTDIIISKSLQDIPYESFAYFILAALGLFLINGIIGLKQKQ